MQANDEKMLRPIFTKYISPAIVQILLRLGELVLILYHTLNKLLLLKYFSSNCSSNFM